MIKLSTFIPLLRLLTLFKQFWSKKAFMPLHYGLLSEMLEWMDTPY